MTVRGAIRLVRVGVVGLIAIAAACSGPSSAPATGSAAIGPSGGTVRASGVQLDVPAGALSATTTISISVDNNGTPSGFRSFSPLYHFSPDGLTFSRPVTVSITAPDADSSAHIFWSRNFGVGYDELATTWGGAVARANVTHFSTGFVAAIPAGDGGKDGGAGAQSGAGSVGAAGHSGGPMGAGGESGMSEIPGSTGASGGAGSGGSSGSAGSNAPADSGAPDAGAPADGGYKGGPLNIQTDTVYFNVTVNGPPNAISPQTETLYAFLYINRRVLATATGNVCVPATGYAYGGYAAISPPITLPVTLSLSAGPDSGLCGAGFEIVVAQFRQGNEVPGTLAQTIKVGGAGPSFADQPFLTTNIVNTTVTLPPASTISDAGAPTDAGASTDAGAPDSGSPMDGGTVNFSHGVVLEGTISGTLNPATDHLQVQVLSTLALYGDVLGTYCGPVGNVDVPGQKANITSLPNTYSFDVAPVAPVCAGTVKIALIQLTSNNMNVPGTTPTVLVCGKFGNANTGAGPLLTSTTVVCDATVN